MVVAEKVITFNSLRIRQIKGSNKMQRQQANNIPVALILGAIHANDIRVLSFQENILSFELSHEIKDISCLSLCLFDFDKHTYGKFTFKNPTIVDIKEMEFSFVYRVIINHQTTKFKNLISKLNKISNQIQKGCAITKFKNLIKEQKIYPSQNDKIFFKNLEEQEKSWFSFELSYSQREQFETLSNYIAIAFALEDRNSYYKYLNQDGGKFLQDELGKKELLGHPIFSQSFSRLYIGNEFCLNLFPEPNLLLELLNKAKSEGFNVTVSLPFIREDNIDHLSKIIESLKEWGQNSRNIELVVNDFGLLSSIKKYRLNASLSLGRLLNKRKKDPKYRWKWGIDKHSKDMKENNLACTHYVDYLKKYNIKRIEFDYDSPVSMSFVPKSYHFPYYQTNTSQYCPLYAECNNLTRTKQEPTTNCPQYCSDFFYLFPKDLKITGRGNSIFGFDSSFFQSPKKLKSIVENDFSRMVFSSK